MNDSEILAGLVQSAARLALLMKETPEDLEEQAERVGGGYLPATEAFHKLVAQAMRDLEGEEIDHVDI